MNYFENFYYTFLQSIKFFVKSLQVQSLFSNQFFKNQLIFYTVGFISKLPQNNVFLLNPLHVYICFLVLIQNYIVSIYLYCTVFYTFKTLDPGFFVIILPV